MSGSAIWPFSTTTVWAPSGLSVDHADRKVERHGDTAAQPRTDPTRWFAIGEDYLWPRAVAGRWLRGLVSS
jgi:hypothetical protein